MLKLVFFFLTKEHLLRVVVVECVCCDIYQVKIYIHVYIKDIF